MPFVFEIISSIFQFLLIVFFLTIVNTIVNQIVNTMANLKSNYTVVFVLIVLLAIVSFVYTLRTKKESLTNNNSLVPPVTMTTVENAYTDMYCVNDDLPLVKLKPTSISCLSKDGVNCLTRRDLAIPDSYACNRSKNSVNNYLSTDALRSDAGKRTFNDLSKKGYFNISCDYDGFNNPNHWCGKLKGGLTDYCASYESDLQRSFDKLCTPDLLTNASQSQSGLPTYSVLYSPDSPAFKLEKCKSDCSRNQNIDMMYCNESCNLCYDPTCYGTRPHKKTVASAPSAPSVNLSGRNRLR
jgi:hypothetical protein